MSPINVALECIYVIKCFLMLKLLILKEIMDNKKFDRTIFNF